MTWRFLIVAALVSQIPSAVPTNVHEVIVAVDDMQGHPVNGLSAADFGVELNGRATSVLAAVTDDAPLAVALLLDQSWSVRTVTCRTAVP